MLSHTTFERYGPGLVSGFKVFDDFLTEGKYSYIGQPHGHRYRPRDRISDEVGGYTETHSMVAVGYREANGTKYFLLQNWWQNKQFVEVDKEYLTRCGGVMYFITTPE